MAEPLLRRGSKGAAVTKLQRALSSVGFDPGTVDGIFGKNTEAAVKSFQSRRGLTADGLVGPLTQGALPTSLVRLHIKTLTNPITRTVDDMVRNMRDTYLDARIGVEVASTETLGPAPLLEDLDVGACTSGSSTAEQTLLFNNRNNVGTNEVVAYFVRVVRTSGVPHPGALNGCASHPAGRPGVAVSATPSPWTLAHEIGHVLGLPHPDAPGACLFDRLMTGCSTNNITNPPPDLVASETTTMDASPLTITL